MMLKITKIMKILSIIPARGGSKGIKLKNLIKLNNIPLITYTIKASINSKRISRTIVSTDHQDIERAAKKQGAEIIQRPKKLATSKISLEPVIQHVLDNLQNHEGYIPDIIVILQNTSPFRNSKHIDDAISKFVKGDFDSLISGFSADYFSWNKMDDNSIIPVDFDPKKRPNRQEKHRQFFENGAIFISKYSSFKKSKCRVSGKIGFYEMPMYLSYDINEKEDLQIIRGILKKFGKKYFS